jgi:two-component system chemotaxis sensor kinase CheA
VTPQSDLAARLLATFVEELEDQVRAANAHLLALERAPDDRDQLRSFFRVMHTLKGAARSAGVPALELICHGMESLLAAARDADRPLSSDEIAKLFEGLDELSAAGPVLRARTSGAGAAASAPAVAAPAAPAAPHADASPREPSREPTHEPPRESALRVSQDRLDELFAISNRLMIVSGALGAVPGRVEELHEAAVRAADAWSRLRRAAPGGTAAPASRGRRDAALLDEALDRLRKISSTLLGDTLQQTRDLDGAVRDAAHGVRGLRMRPFADALADLPRLTRDVATATHKRVRLETSGEAVQADRAVLAQMHDALVHLVRNAIDHGIEPPAVRRARGKPEEGMVRVSAALIGDRILVTVQDDGAGLDLAALRAQLAARGEEPPADPAALARRLFLGGVSARAAATEISGRGVGLDAVRAATERVRGNVDVQWGAGTGTTFTIDAPLTLATVRAVLARVGGVHVAIPAAFVERLIRARVEELRVVDGRAAVETGEAPAPVASLATILGPPLVDRRPDGAVLLALVRAGDRRVALRVDELLEETELVIRPIRAHGRVAVPHVSGAAMLPSGVVALVLNVVAALSTALGLPPDAAPIVAPRTPAESRKRVLVVDDSITTRTLEASVLEAAGYEVFTAVDGADGWRVLQERGADLVVTDVEMPRMDGLELTESIRGSARFRETPVVLVTALESAEHRARGLEVGADAYLGKSSFEQEGLLTTVRDLLGS